MDSQGQEVEGVLGYVFPDFYFEDRLNHDEPGVFRRVSQEPGILRRLSQNDPGIVGLDLDLVDIASIRAKEVGLAISKSMHLRSLMIEAQHEDDGTDDGYGPYHPYQHGLASFFMGLAENRSIEDFSLDRFNYSHMDMDVFRTLAPFFERNHNLRSISIECSVKLHERVPSLISALVNTAGLKFIEISYNGLEDSIAADLINALRSMPGLHNLLELRLGGNTIGQQGCAALRQLLRHPACKIQCLHIHHNHLDNVCIDILYGGLVANNSIKFIDIHCQKFVTASGWGVFFHLFFNSICSVERIDARGNDIGDAGMISLGNSLGTSCSIEKLDLRDSRLITISGWTGFSKGLRSPTCSLLDLDISNCDINDSGALAVAIALAENTSLKVLNMSSNRNITSSGWIDCFHIMRQNEIRLKRLDLSDNNIDDLGATMLVTILVNMSALDSFTLSNMTSISSDGWREFADVLKPRSLSKLRVLNLGKLHNAPPQMDDSVIICFADALIGNTSLSELLFHGYELSDVGRCALANTLCDKSSLINTYYSNHTLQAIEYRRAGNGDLRSLLDMNHHKSKVDVARRKILANHFEDDGAYDRIFAPMLAPTLPTALSWIGRDRREYSIMYNFLHSMPWQLDSTAISSTE
jgi:hypothetical protein